MSKDLAKYLLSLLLFGSNGVIASMIALDSSHIVLGRTFFGFTVLLALVAISRIAKKNGNKPSVKDALLVFLSGISLGASWICIFESFARIGVGLSMLLYYCGGVLVMALSPLFFKEKITTKKAVCFAVVLTGVFLVNGGSIALGLDPFGIALAGIAALCYSVMIIIGKKATEIEGADRAAIQLGGSFITALAIMMVSSQPILQSPGATLPWLLLLGAFSTGFGCFIYFGAAAKLPAQTVATCGYLEPLSAVAFSAIFLGETLGTAQLLGGFLIIAGTIAFELVDQKKKKAKEVAVKNCILFTTNDKHTATQFASKHESC